MALNKNVEITEEITRSKRAATATAAAAAVVAAVAAAAMAKGNASTWFPASLAVGLSESCPSCLGQDLAVSQNPRQAGPKYP